MYIPKHYENSDNEEILNFISEYNFACLTSTLNNRIVATHLPLIYDKDESGEAFLYGHLSKSNLQWKSFDNQQEVLAVFLGPNAYISPSWYHSEEVPTWNYVAVHIYGKARVISNAELISSMQKLMHKHEKKVDSPMRLEHFSKQTMAQIEGVVGFKVSIDEIQAAYKLSQKRSAAENTDVTNHLQNSNDSGAKQLAEMMKQKNKL